MKVKGKFLYEGNDKFYIKGVTYGTFKPDRFGYHFPEKEIIEKDFSLMVQNGINSIRTYTVPSIELLDLANKFNLKVMVGIPWEQHITFLDENKRRSDIVKRVRDEIIKCDKHPAILCYVIGNEIPSSIVRWYGKEKIENFLKLLFKTVKKVDGQSLVTYVNYPTTEYLDLDFLDFDCFNVYLETREKLGNYLSRLQSLSGDRPLVLAEIGLDSRRNGNNHQAEILKWQIETVFAKGCAGIFVFAWTDEWWRGGWEIEDWDFGLVDRERKPKPALFAASSALGNIPFSKSIEFPKISVIICSYNGSSTIKKCIEGILQVDYPLYEIIVVNDGSTDNTAEIVSKYPVRLINTENCGLSNARNTGMNHAEGEIIAYIDDDAYPDSHWLQYLAYAYLNSEHSCIGGPNIAPYDSEFISTCVANAPGGPVHVLVSDEIAEHVPGCNMSFRKDVLQRIGGFDPVFRAAGDDVDVCWRIIEAGGTIGFHPSALVWHHRRNSVKAYWKQQKGYGKAEALLEAKWPEKYNSLGHITWSGRIYGNGFTLPIKTKKNKIFHGTWGTSLFQSVYESSESYISSIPLMPEWYLVAASTGILGCLGILWHPLIWMWVLFSLMISIIFIQAIISGRKNSSLQPHQKKESKYIFLIIFLHIIQPIARLYGRFSNGLTPWRKRGATLNSKYHFGFGSRIFTLWSEEWKSTEEWLLMVEKNLLNFKTRIKRGDDFADWDIEVRNGLYGRMRGLLTIEEHGAGKQLLRFKCSPQYKIREFIVPIFLAFLSVFAFAAHQYTVAAVTTIFLSIIVLIAFVDTARSMNSLHIAFRLVGQKETFETEMAETKEEINQILSESVQPKFSGVSNINIDDRFFTRTPVEEFKVAGK